MHMMIMTQYLDTLKESLGLAGGDVCFFRWRFFLGGSLFKTITKVEDTGGVFFASLHIRKMPNVG